MRYSFVLQTRGGAVWQLVGLITRRSQVQILSPQPDSVEKASRKVGLFVFGQSLAGRGSVVLRASGLRLRRRRAMTTCGIWPIIPGNADRPQRQFRCQSIDPPVLPAHSTPAATEKFHKPATGSPASAYAPFQPASSLIQALILSCLLQPTSIARIVDEHSRGEESRRNCTVVRP